MNANTRIGKKQRRLRLGVGTAMALLLGIGLAVTGRLATSPNLSPTAGRVVFEADAQGKLRRVDASSKQEAPLFPLWKPEPSFLLINAQALNLNTPQRAEIGALIAQWSGEKSRMERGIEVALSGANSSLQNTKSGEGVSAASVKENLKDYSQLSREYEERRADVWRHSLSFLTAKQQANLNSLMANRRTK